MVIHTKKKAKLHMRTAMIRFPKLIKAAEEKFVCVREDLKARDAALLTSAEFAITVGNVTFTE